MAAQNHAHLPILKKHVLNVQIAKKREYFLKKFAKQILDLNFLHCQYITAVQVGVQEISPS
jgi:hypothetical protein